MDKIISKISVLETREDFVEFVTMLAQDLGKHPNDWENNDLRSYLEALAAWTQDMDGYYKNMNLPLPNKVDWKVFANILMAATMYE